jgi:hypothetical protein
MQTLHCVGGALAYGDPREDFGMGSGPILAIFADEAKARAYLDAEYAAPGAVPRPSDYLASGDLFPVTLPGGRAWAVVDS